MTTPWKVPQCWQGQTVAVLASGPSMSQELADSVRHLPRIAVRRAHRLAPDADMVLALDGPPNEGFWPELEQSGFAGIRICGVECDLDAMYLHLPHERVVLGAGNIIETRNNGLAAIRVAAMAGASKILLLGFDPETNGHFYDAITDPGYSGEWYPGLTAGLAALFAELRGQGIDIEFVREVATPKPRKK